MSTSGPRRKARFVSNQDGHTHHHDHGHQDAHGHGDSRLARWRHQTGHLLKPHSHESADKIDSALESSAKGMRALWTSLAVLGVTAVAQAVVVVLSGSVALLGDTVHNAADALTALPLGVAFVLGRRAANRRFTYGYGRAEDLAGIVIVLTIAASAAFAAWTAIDRLLNPQDISYLPVVAAAAVIGFLGNEWVARYRIRVGRDIGSAALVADGLHARTDGFTSLAVLLGAGGAAIGWQLADPIVGLAITAAILLVLRDACREVFRRIMDAVDPALVDAAEHALDVAGRTGGQRTAAALDRPPAARRGRGRRGRGADRPRGAPGGRRRRARPPARSTETDRSPGPRRPGAGAGCPRPASGPGASRVSVSGRGAVQVGAERLREFRCAQVPIRFGELGRRKAAPHGCPLGGGQGTWRGHKDPHRSASIEQDHRYAPHLTSKNVKDQSRNAKAVTITKGLIIRRPWVRVPPAPLSATRGERI